MSANTDNGLCWNCKSVLEPDPTQLSLSNLDKALLESNILDSELFHHVLFDDSLLESSLAEFPDLELGTPEALTLESLPSQQVVELATAPPSDSLHTPPWTDSEWPWQLEPTSANQLSPRSSQSSEDTLLSLFSCSFTSDGTHSADPLSTTWIDAFIGKCQTRFPQLKVEMDAAKKRQPVTLENEFIVYACFQYRKDYHKVANVFCSWFGFIHTSSVRMRFCRMMKKKGNGELFNLSSKIHPDRKYTRTKGVTQDLLRYR